ncbi:hypothetical protein Tco_1005519 [Tanacetum coccineum]|uniref:Uncharacterized protein n=1 Tax=Tanacetum coccineum TaxID=301880 RepID=A0ABQ5FEY0_9ASTR
MPKPPSTHNTPSKENSFIAPSNQASPQHHSPPLIDPYVDVVLQANQNHNQTQFQPPPSPTREMLIDDKSTSRSIKPSSNASLKSYH